MFGPKNKTHSFSLVNEAGIQLMFPDAVDLQKELDEVADAMKSNGISIATEWTGRPLVR